MKVCVVGAGAIGSWIGARLANSGNDVCLVTRGEHLESIRRQGLRLVSGATEENVRLPASDRPESFGVQDIVFLTVKAHSIGAVLPYIHGLLGDGTAVVPAVNGVPWWYFYREGGPMEGTSMACIDPGGTMLRARDPARIVGCVVAASAEVTSPGTVTLASGNRLVPGEPDDSLSERLGAIAGALCRQHAHLDHTHPAESGLPNALGFRTGHFARDGKRIGPRSECDAPRRAWTLASSEGTDDLYGRPRTIGGDTWVRNHEPSG